jgi:adenylate kinase
VGLLPYALAKPAAREGRPAKGEKGPKGGDRLANLTEQLSLTTAQVEQIKPILNSERDAMRALMQDTSTDREAKRPKMREIREAHNAKVRAEGGSELLERRDTDMDPEAARQRYRVFKERTWDALQSLRELYHYHFVNAQGDIRDVENNILKELAYQSSLELDPETYDAVRHIPLASEIVVHARQELVRRLDSYQLEHTELFHQVVRIIEERFLPIVRRHAIAGLAVVNSEDPVFDHSLALAMVIDVFAERGFRAVANVNRAEVPHRVDLTTGEIICAMKKIYRFQVRFSGSAIRRGEN